MDIHAADSAFVGLIEATTVAAVTVQQQLTSARARGTRGVCIYRGANTDDDYTVGIMIIIPRGMYKILPFLSQLQKWRGRGRG